MDWRNAPVRPPEGVQAPDIRRVYIPNAGKQRNARWACRLYLTGRCSAARTEVLSAIYEQDFLACSFGGRPRRGAHRALATLDEVIAGRKGGCSRRI
jgi:RNA-directed DNA polymerase